MNQRFLCFDDYQVGMSGMTSGAFGTRTITDVDVVNFACLTADYHRNHLDQLYMSNSIYGIRVAHGLLGTSLAIGMLSLCCPQAIGRDVPGAYLHSFTVDYRRGIKLGETISVKWRISSKLEETIYPGYGGVESKFELVDHEAAALYEGTVSFLVPKSKDNVILLKLTPLEPESVEEFTPSTDQDYYSDDYPIGKGGETAGRTITEADVLGFAGLTGDFNPYYIDSSFARDNMFGERVVPDLLLFDYAFGLWSRERNRYREPKSNIAGHLNDKSTFFSPARIGDTIRCRYRNTDSRLSRSRPGAGILTTELQIINQRNELIQKGYVIQMIPSRPSA